MAQNFIACDREQELLLPPSLREWLPEGHLAWFVLDAVGVLQVSARRLERRNDGRSQTLAGTTYRRWDSGCGQTKCCFAWRVSHKPPCCPAGL